MAIRDAMWREAVLCGEGDDRAGPGRTAVSQQPVPCGDFAAGERCRMTAAATTLPFDIPMTHGGSREQAEGDVWMRR